MNNNLSTGSLGEDLACDYLKSKGYSIVERNFRKPWGEIDIVCKEKDKTVVFVEVKTMNEGELMPEDNMTRSKIGKMKKAAMLYAGYRQKLIDKDRGWRIDMIAITLPSENNNGAQPKIEHYENIV